MLYLIEPEVAGGHGEFTEYEVREEGQWELYTKVKKLHYEFEGWMGDDIVESTPTFIVRERVKEGLDALGVGGYEIEECIVTVSEQFKDLYGDKVLPKFYRLMPQGRLEIEEKRVLWWSGEGISLTSKGGLVVTEKVLDVFRDYRIEFCGVLELDTEGIENM